MHGPADVPLGRQRVLPGFPRQAGDQSGQGSPLNLGAMSQNCGDLLRQPGGDIETMCDLFVRSRVHNLAAANEGFERRHRDPRQPTRPTAADTLKGRRAELESRAQDTENEYAEAGRRALGPHRGANGPPRPITVLRAERSAWPEFLVCELFDYTSR
jgi:hypothetical protein